MNRTRPPWSRAPWSRAGRWSNIAPVVTLAAGEVPHFLIAYQRSTGTLLQVRAFTSTQVDEAVTLRIGLEQQHRGDPDFEVVLLASRSEAELRQTHARYFKNLVGLIKPGDPDVGGDGGPSAP